MQEKVNVRQALRVFNTIYEQGNKIDDVFVMDGIRASTGFDGYTVTLFNDFVQLDIFFHNKFSLTYSNKKERDQFMEKLEKIDQLQKRRILEKQ